MDAHGASDGAHLFGDVGIFDPSKGSKHFCFTCNTAHEIPGEVDVLASGPSCKSLSKMFQDRKLYGD